MKKTINFFSLLFIILILISSGCESDDVQREYEKCTSVCASVLEDDFITLKLCVDECKEKFLDKG